MPYVHASWHSRETEADICFVLVLKKTFTSFLQSCFKCSWSNIATYLGGYIALWGFHFHLMCCSWSSLSILRVTLYTLKPIVSGLLHCENSLGWVSAVEGGDCYALIVQCVCPSRWWHLNMSQFIYFDSFKKMKGVGLMIVTVSSIVIYNLFCYFAFP